MITILAPKSSQNRLIKILVCTTLVYIVHYPSQKHSYMEGKKLKRMSRSPGLCLFRSVNSHLPFQTPLSVVLSANGVTQGIVPEAQAAPSPPQQKRKEPLITHI